MFFMKTTYCLLILMSLMFLMSNHPLILGLILIIQTVLISLLLGGMSQTFWFSYILFLVLIGGMLILFIYVISLIFNKIFIQILNLKKMIFPIMFTLIFMMLNKNFMFNNLEMMPKWQSMILNKEISINLIKLYNFPMNLINLLMINYLFFLLIVVVKITNFYYGPLRMKI